MNKTVIKFGKYAFLTAAILFLSALVLGKNLSYSAQEVLGYSSIVISLVFVFFGIKNYRDQENGGFISFGKALKIGLLITLFAALGFAIIDFIYTAYINPDFVQQSLKDLESQYSGAELASKKAELNSSMEYMNSGFMAFIMFSTVVLIGFVISLISSLILNKK